MVTVLNIYNNEDEGVEKKINIQGKRIYIIKDILVFSPFHQGGYRNYRAKKEMFPSLPIP